MKHLIPFRIYESQETSGLTKRQVKFLNKYTAGSWSVNQTTGLVDVQGNFDCSNQYRKSLSGISFGHVNGNFNCNSNQLTSLEGAPNTVSEDFVCFNNRLTSLEGAPQTVGNYFDCSINQLQTLEGAPQTVVGDFRCSTNDLQSLKGSPQTVGRDFQCSGNKLTSLAGAPQTVNGVFSCRDNELTSLEGAPQTVGGGFYCDLFEIQKGKWNMEGWGEVLNKGTTQAKKLILTLPGFQPEYWNSKLKEDPKATTLKIVTLWDDLPKETQDGIQIPSNWKDSFDNLLDLQRAGIF